RWAPSLFAVLVVTAIIIPTFAWAYRRQMARERTLRIVVSKDQVKRVQQGHDDITIGAPAITRQLLIPGRGLLVYAGRSWPEMTIPETLEEFEDCCNLLRAFRPVEVRSRRALGLRLAIPVGIVLAMVELAFKRATDPRLVTVLGAVSVVAM